MARILRGEIRWADLNPVRGHEQAGERPVLVLSHNVFNERSGTVIAVALTSRSHGRDSRSPRRYARPGCRNARGSRSARSAPSAPNVSAGGLPGPPTRISFVSSKVSTKSLVDCPSVCFVGPTSY